MLRKFKKPEISSYTSLSREKTVIFLFDGKLPWGQIKLMKYHRYECLILVRSSDISNS